MGLITNNTISIKENLFNSFEANKWLPIVVTMPQNGDVLTLIPHFHANKKPDRHSLRIIEVKNGCMPMSGPVKSVINDILHYDELIKLRQELDACLQQCNTNPEEIPFYEFEEI